MKNTTQKPGIVFAHGIWADGSCFQKLVPTLQAEGHEVICAQYNLDSLKTDVEACIRHVARVNSPIVLIGHSYGGVVITHAGTDSRVAALVYISALGPDETETGESEQAKFPKTDVFKSIEVSDGRVWMKPEGIGYFCGDLSEQEQKVVWATAMPPAADLFAHKLEGIAWRSKPSWYIVAKKDHSVHPDLERAAAKRMGAKTVELDSSHVPMLSQPGAVLEVIRSAVEAVSSSR